MIVDVTGNELLDAVFFATGVIAWILTVLSGLWFAGVGVVHVIRTKRRRNRQRMFARNRWGARVQSTFPPKL